VKFIKKGTVIINIKESLLKSMQGNTGRYLLPNIVMTKKTSHFTISDWP